MSNDAEARHNPWKEDLSEEPARELPHELRLLQELRKDEGVLDELAAARIKARVLRVMEQNPQPPRPPQPPQPAA